MGVWYGDSYGGMYGVALRACGLVAWRSFKRISAARRAVERLFK